MESFNSFQWPKKLPWKQAKCQYTDGIRTHYPEIWHFGILNLLSYRKIIKLKQNLTLRCPLLTLLLWNRPQNSHGKVASLNQEQRRHSYHHRWGIWGQNKKSVQTNHVKLALVFLVTSSPLTTPSPNLFLCQLFTNVLLLYLKHRKASCFADFFGPSFSHEGSQVDVQI